MKNKGFTLIELLVVVAIIGILATVVLASLGSARTRAKDSAVLSAVSGYRSEVELEFEGDYTGLCASSSYGEINTYVTGQGGNIENCDADLNGYRIITSLPSALATTVGIKNAYAQSADDGFCVNSFGYAQRVSVADAQSLDAPYCSVTENGAIYAPNFNNLCAVFPGTYATKPANASNGCDFSQEYIYYNDSGDPAPNVWDWACCQGTSCQPCTATRV